MSEGALKLAPLLTEIKVDTGGFREQMRQAGKDGVKSAEEISRNIANAAKVGDVLVKTGTAMTKGLTLPIIGAATATTKMRVDFESSFGKVSTLLDENIVDFDRYKDSLLDASDDTKVAVDGFSEAVYNSISAGTEQTKAIGFTTTAMKLAKGGFTDGAKAVDVLTTAINAYGMKADDATRVSDLLITTQNLGKTTVDELASSMGKIIPTANAYKVGIEDVTTILADLTKNGIATAEAVTYSNGMLNELGKSGTEADKVLRKKLGKGFAQLMQEGVSLTECLKVLKDKAENSGKSLSDMFGSAEAAKAALTIMKDDGVEYNQILNEMRSSAGATQEAFEKIDSTPAEQLKGSLNELRNAGIKFGAAFVPVIGKVSDVISNVAEKFSNLSEKEQENIIKWGGLLAVTGPVVSVFGGTIKTFTKLSDVMSLTSTALGATGGGGIVGGLTGLSSVCVPAAAAVTLLGGGMYAMHENMQMMNRSVIESKEEMSLMERALAKLQGVEVRSREELENLGLIHKEFSENISPEFQKAVEDSTEKIYDFSVYLRKMGFDDVISEKESAEFTARVNAMCDDAINTIQSKKEESQAALKGLFLEDDKVVDESEQRVLEILSKSSDAQIEEVSRLKKEILEIEQHALEEKRALSDSEIAEIERKHERVRQIELEALGGTQEEIAYAKNEFYARVRRMNAEAASELLQEKAKMRDDELIEIQASYDTEIEMLKANLAKCEAEDRADFEEQIANLESDKKDKIQLQNELWNDYMKIVMDKNPQLVDAINKYNGEILTNEEIQSAKLLAEMQERYEGIGKIEESGCYYMYNKTKDTYEQVAVTVDAATGDIIAMHSDLRNETGAAWKEIGEATKRLAKSENASFELITGAHLKYDASSGTVVSAAGGVQFALKAVEEQADGTRTGIIDLNGTPVKVQVNKDGAVSALNEVRDAVNSIPEYKKIMIQAISSGQATSRDVYNYYANGGSRLFNGIDNVPYDGYRAVLHKNERVLTAEENKRYTSGADGTDYGAIRKIVRNELQNITITLNDREFGRACSRHAKR